MTTTEKRLLCIENQNEMIDLYRLILAGNHCKVIGALEGDEGLREARAFHPDLILLDLMMPGMDGWQVLRELKADAATSDIPVIVVTAWTEDAEKVMPVEDYITKPFEPGALRERVHRVLARSAN